MRLTPRLKSLAIGTTACGLLLGAMMDHARAGDLKARADLFRCTDSSLPSEVRLGAVKLKEKKKFFGEGLAEVEVEVKIEGLERGKHGVHIHETAACTPCGAAGGHFDPGDFDQTNPDLNHPFHLGDLPNIEVKKDGKGHMKAKTTRVTLSAGPLSVFDDDGSAVIVHVEEDTFCLEGNNKDADGNVAGAAVPGCAGGARAACGIISWE